MLASTIAFQVLSIPKLCPFELSPKLYTRKLSKEIDAEANLKHPYIHTGTDLEIDVSDSCFLFLFDSKNNMSLKKNSVLNLIF